MGYILAACITLGTPQAEPIAEATRGITGQVTVQVEDGMLRGRPDLDLDSPLLVRVAAIRVQPDGGHQFDLEVSCREKWGGRGAIAKCA